MPDGSAQSRFTSRVWEGTHAGGETSAIRCGSAMGKKQGTNVSRSPGGRCERQKSRCLLLDGISAVRSIGFGPGNRAFRLKLHERPTSLNSSILITILTPTRAGEIPRLRELTRRPLCASKLTQGAPKPRAEQKTDLHRNTVIRLADDQMRPASSCKRCQFSKRSSRASSRSFEGFP
jgi:hypothetical protein